MLAATAKGNYKNTGDPQIISFSAPTGSGKTIVLASLFENIFNGDWRYEEQPDAIFIWLSDSPQLNEQTRLKFEAYSYETIRSSQLITIDDASFDSEVLEDGKIYFLNTQKLGKSSNLTKHSDSRQYTIWETLENTIQEKPEKLYFVIDEAHRGARNDRETKTATTIMQKFILGSKEDGISPMPLVIGVTATPERFNQLAGKTDSTVHTVRIDPDDVRRSGLLKDSIIVSYPGESGHNEMAMLQAAVDDWQDKCDHWRDYCVEQHAKMVNPILVVQVLAGHGNAVSDTDLDECLKVIEERIGKRFTSGEVVHTFGGDLATIRMNGLDVYYCDPSRVAEDMTIKVVFFKENLSTGWDCPRAETMMSFRRAVEATYIAQLLGRMVRTPLARHIAVDETLNSVKLFLPNFDEETVTEVINALKSVDGLLPTDVHEESKRQRLTVNRPQRSPVAAAPSHSYGSGSESRSYTEDAASSAPGSNMLREGPAWGSYGQEYHRDEDKSWEPAFETGISDSGETEPAAAEHTEEEWHDEPLPEPETYIDRGFDNREILKAINDMHLKTYVIRNAKHRSYYDSLFDLAGVLSRAGVYASAKMDVTQKVIGKIHSYVEKLKKEGAYDSAADDVTSFSVESRMFDVFGESVKDDDMTADSMFSTTYDIDRQYEAAERRLGRKGVAQAYLNEYGDLDDLTRAKIEVIIAANDEGFLSYVENWCKTEYYDMEGEYRRYKPEMSEGLQIEYDRIVTDSDKVTEHLFQLPEDIEANLSSDGKTYEKHLYVDPETDSANLKLDNWVDAVLKEEMAKDDFVCWLRNEERKKWALCIPYKIGDEDHAVYPDILIVRRLGADQYIVDVLEPHRGNITDNLPKVKGFARYARNNPRLGHIELIRKIGSKFVRLDVHRGDMQEAVRMCMTNEDLDSLFNNIAMQ